MKRIVLIAIPVVVVAGLAALAGTALWESQRADYGWRPEIDQPTFATEHPLVVIDEAHHNASTAGIGGRYWPFARLLKADGFAVRRGRALFSAESLAGVSVLVIANASGAAKPQFMGINLPGGGEGRREDPAFSAGEIRAVLDWIERGGSLLLVADHAPFGASARALAAALGVTMHGGFTEVPDELSDPLLFSRENGRLGEHPILSGASLDCEVQRVMTFTGQSLDGPAEAVELLRLPETAFEYVREGGALVPKPAGRAQGLALEYGAGRVVVLGEAAMLTAQRLKAEKFGMNMPGNDNRRFALNVMYWLARQL